MAQLEEANDALVSASEAGIPKSLSSVSGRSANKNDAEVSDESDQGSGKEGDASDQEEEEYEIEGILDSKRGMFKKTEMAYLVKWKSYGPEHNSWVTESDAGNAQELINEFFKKKAKAKEQSTRLSAVRGRKPASAKTPKSTRGGSPDAESVSTTKRGRGKADTVSDEEEDETPRKAKKSRGAVGTNGTSSGKRGTLAALDKDDEDVMMTDANGAIDESRPYTTMKDLDMGTMKSWEAVVKAVTTVERHKEDLMVYFELTDGRYVREPSSTCRKRFPQKLLDFYETHLRWREVPGEVAQTY